MLKEEQYKNAIFQFYGSCSGVLKKGLGVMPLFPLPPPPTAGSGRHMYSILTQTWSPAV